MKWIFTSLAPNMEADDKKLARQLLFHPGRWRKGEAAHLLEKWFLGFLGVGTAQAFVSGRTALYAILKSLALPENSEVLLQAYTCVAVPDPVLWAGLKPIYVDCDKTLTMSSTDLEKKITPQSKVLIIQHTFGQPADLTQLLAIAKRHQLLVIEDCAHALGATYDGKRLGSFGDAAFFSFGRDKVVSSVFGGMAVTRDSELGRRLKSFERSFTLPSSFWVLQQLMHPIVLWFVKKHYNFFGKLVLEASKRLRIISKAVYTAEKKGKAPGFVFHTMPNAMAELALHQCAKLDRLNAHRRKLAAWYDGQTAHVALMSRPKRLSGNAGIFLRYTVFHPDAQALIAFCRAHAIELGDWYTVPIAPPGVAASAVGYKPGSCPVAEELSTVTLNLPTHIGITSDAGQKIMEVLKEYQPKWRPKQ